MPAEILEYALLSCGILLAFWLLLWAISLLARDSSIGDPLYPMSFLIVTVVFFAVSSGSSPRQRLVLALSTIWAVRLLGYIGWRNWGREDPRYARLRAHAASLGRSYAWYSLTHVFLWPGAVTGFVIAIPLFMAERTADPASLGPLAWAGAALVAAGIILESVADAQLARFRRDPLNANQIMSRGLWRYSRHPNYFGESLVWIGFFLIALETAWGWLALASPMMVLWILLGPMGIGLLERRMRKKRPQAFAIYRKRTSAFIPWFPWTGD